MALSKSFKRTLFILTAALGFPALLWVAAEWGLRAAGYGYDARFFYRATSGDGTPVYRANPQFSRTFFPDALKRLPMGFELPVEKDPAAYRVFVLGESAAMGDPYADFSLARMLQRLLAQAHPELRFEVVNAAVTGINSHAVRLIAADVAALEPDFFAIYAGNNEVIGPYGSGTIFHAGLDSSFVIRAGIALRRQRLGQALDALLRPASAAGVPASWGGPAMFLEQPRPWGDPRLERTYAQFAENLDAIIREGRASGAGVAVATMAVNLRDQPPFASAGTLDEATEVLLNAALAAPDKVDGVALAAAQAAHPEHAGLAFALARVQLQRGEGAAARRLFEMARDRDTLRLRCDARLLEVTHQVAAEAEVPLIDFAADLATAAPHGIPGDEALWEHVHLRPEATYRLARRFFQAVESDLLRRQRIAAPTAESAIPSWEWLTQSLPITRHDDLMLGDLLIERFSHAPFVGLPGNETRLEAARQRRQGALADLRTKAAQEAIAQQYTAALRRWPDDPYLYLSQGIFLITARRFEPARQSLEQARRHLPHDPDVLFKLARACAQLGRHDEAIDALRHLGTIAPDYPRRRVHLTESLVALQRYPEALAVLGEQLARQSDDLGSRLARAQVYWQSKDTTAARADLQAVEAANPTVASLWVQLASVWFRMGEADKGRAALDRAARINPSDPTLIQFLMRHQAPPAQSPGAPSPRP